MVSQQNIVCVLPSGLLLGGGGIVTRPYFVLTLEGVSLKKLNEGIRGGGGGSQSDSTPLLLTPFTRLTRYLAHIMSVLCTFN